MYKSTAVLFLIVTFTFAGTIHYDWNISPSDIQIDSFDEWDVISIDEGMAVFANGYPNLPAIPRCYVIPQGTTVTSVEMANVSTVSLGRTMLPVPVMLLPLSGDVPEFPNYTESSLEGMSCLFPTSPIAGFKTGTKTGFRLGSYSFVPFVYNQQTGELLLVTSAEINLIYEIDSEAPMYTLSEGQIELAKMGIATFVDNPGMLDSWAPLNRPDTDEDIQVLVVGHSEHAAQLSELATFHETMGYSSDSISIERIMENEIGYDSREQMRNYIIDLYQNNGLLFVVICGDREVPIGLTRRISKLEFPYWETLMSSTADLYFSDLDGTWDDNENHLYGEEFDGMDYYSDVYVGRYPAAVDQVEELDVMIEKTILYNTSPVAGEWQKRALLMGAVSFPTQPAGDWRFASKYCDSLETFFPEDWSAGKVYEDTTGYHPNNQLELFNEGTAITAYGAHGNAAGFYWYYPYPEWPPIMNNGTVPQMNNGGMLPWVLGSNSCSTGSINYNGFAERLIEHEGGGAIVVMASSESSFGGFTEPGPGGWLGIYFAHLLFDQDIVTAGVAHGLSKDMFWANWNTFYIPRMAEWCIQALNLYGDPCTVFIGAPEGVESGAPQQLNTHISPNPVWHTMSVNVTLPQAAPVKVSVYDMLGRVALLRNEEMFGAGEQSLDLDASSLPAGIYMVNVVAGGQANTVKCVVLR